MGLWSKKKVDPLDLNKGYEWTKDDQVAVEELNAMTNCSLYAQDFVEKLVTNIDVSEAGVVGTPSVTLVDGDGATEGKPYKKFKFANLKGEKGDTGGVAPVVQGTGTATGSVMSQNAVTTELEGKANLDASNLSSENVTSWSNKLGIGTLTTELTGKVNLDASNLSSENVTSWSNKLGCENVKTIYNKNSTDPSINLGYTSGLTNGLNVNGSFDTENVKYYLVTVRMNAINFCLRYDPNTYSEGTYTNSFGQLGYVTFEDSSVGYFYTCSMYITSSTIKVNKLGFWRNSTTLNTNDTFYVSKIEAIY